MSEHQRTHLRGELPGLVALRTEDHVVVRVSLGHTGHQSAPTRADTQQLDREGGQQSNPI